MIKLYKFFHCGRYKGELYLLPTIRFAWGKDTSFELDPRSYWIGFYWIQWSVHFGFTERAHLQK